MAVSGSSPDNDKLVACLPACLVVAYIVVVVVVVVYNSTVQKAKRKEKKRKEKKRKEETTTAARVRRNPSFNICRLPSTTFTCLYGDNSTYAVDRHEHGTHKRGRRLGEYLEPPQNVPLNQLTRILL